MKAFIKGISYHLPEKVLTNEDLLKDFPEWSVEKVASKIGIASRHVAGENETASDMGVAAAEKLIEEYNIDRTSIDFILFCTQSPDYFLPATACTIQERLGLRTDTGALDFNQGCSGYVYGLSLAKGLIISGIARNILFITSETYTKHIHPRDKSNRTIFGDAAAATLISEEGFAEIMNFSLGTDGRGAENLIVRTGGMRKKDLLQDLRFDEGGNPLCSDNLYMNGTEILSFTLDVVPALVQKVLAANDLNQEDIGLFVFHQANRYMMEFLRKKMKINPERFYYYMENTGNTVSSTIPIALRAALDRGDLSGVKNIMLAGFGVGYSWGGTILRF
ncbi:MAG: ketoacyl-ACP synthase III [Bacteroidales bacterium]|jgi:3-oxoacyl-[acyl-carrier-protein] synthase-3|nr:ketoacyl-ACP synthase III [Bacteroidales bacterium]